MQCLASSHWNAWGVQAAPKPAQPAQPSGEGVWEGQVEIEEGNKWIASGKSWFGKASKRIAAVAKETTTVIQARLEEIDPRFLPRGVFDLRMMICQMF